MFIVTSFVSIALVAANSKVAGRLVPRVVVPCSFAVSGALFVSEWLLIDRAPRGIAVMVYLHISGAGPLLGSGFWLIASERFDPRTAKRRFGQIAGIGTLGGLAGGVVAERFGAILGVSALLPFLGLLNVICAWVVWRLAAPQPEIPMVASAPVRSGLRVLLDAPYLRNLAALTLIVTTGAGLADYAFKATIAETVGRGDGLLRFFAIYYAATGLITFAVQASSSRFMLERWGLAAATGTPSLALVLGSAAGLLVPGAASVVVMRAGESILRGSLFRAGYELFFTPIPRAEKRAVKSVIDVGFDRLGDAVAGGVLRIVLFSVVPAARLSTVLALTIVCATVAFVFASRLNRGYIDALEKGLLQRAVDLDLGEVEDLTTRTAMLRTLGHTQVDIGWTRVERERSSTAEGTVPAGIGLLVRFSRSAPPPPTK
jgi:ATP:ADP antiporter, AAA family